MNKPNIIPKRDFIGKPAPPGYIAGVGRGATGFTTRSDLGPAREPSAIASSSSASHSRNHGDDGDEESEYLNEANYDDFAGYKGSLFNKEDPYEEDDKEADRIYEEIDKHLDERGKALREKKRRTELKLYRQVMPKIQHQFSDLVEDMKQVSEVEWVNLPEVGDSRNRKQRVAKPDKYTPLPESLLAEQARISSGGETLLYIHPNIEDMNECRSSIISTTLNLASRTVDNEVKTTDQEKYLEELDSSKQLKRADNLQQRRGLYETMLKTRDKSIKAKVYLMYIELEERAGKLSNARSLAMKACEECPSRVELWCEAVRLHPIDKSKQIMINALRAQPKSLILWLKAAELESEESNKRNVYQKARILIPQEPEIWYKSAQVEISAGNLPDAKRLLEFGVAEFPNNPEFQTTLAQIEDMMASKSNIVSSTCSLAVKTEPDELSATDQVTYREASDSSKHSKKGDDLEERRAHHENMLKTKDKSMKAKVYLMYIELEERAGKLSNARSLAMKACEECPLSVEVWLEAVRLHPIDRAKQIMTNALGALPKSLTLWMKAADLECDTSNKIKVYEKARNYIPKEPEIWYQSAQLEISAGNLREAIQILKLGLMSCKTSIDLWLNLANLREKSESIPIARSTLEKARHYNPHNARLYMESARLEIRAFLHGSNRYKGSSDTTRRPDLADSFIAEGIKKCRGQVEEVEALKRLQTLVKERKFDQCLQDSDCRIFKWPKSSEDLTAMFHKSPDLENKVKIKCENSS